MEKEKVAVYLKVYSNDEEEMEKAEKRVRNYCKERKAEIVEMVKDYKDDNSLEDLCLYVQDKDNEVYTLITNEFDMISKNVYEVYDYFVYLRDYCYCNLVTLSHGNNYHFNIAIKEGIKSE